jgi:hypothetical protein
VGEGGRWAVGDGVAGGGGGGGGGAPGAGGGGGGGRRRGRGELGMSDDG